MNVQKFAQGGITVGSRPYIPKNWINVPFNPASYRKLGGGISWTLTNVNGFQMLRYFISDEGLMYLQLQVDPGESTLAGAPAFDLEILIPGGQRARSWNGPPFPQDCTYGALFNPVAVTCQYLPSYNNEAWITLERVPSVAFTNGAVGLAALMIFECETI